MPARRRFGERREGNLKDFSPPEPFIPDSPGSYHKGIKAFKGGEPATCNFDCSEPMAETVVLGNNAYRVGLGFEWDTKTMTAVNCEPMNELVRPSYREGWPL